MNKDIKRVLVTGGAGQIAYSLLFRIANGDLLGTQPISLHILDLPQAVKTLEGIKMELEDCAFPLLKEIRIGSDVKKMFEGVHYAFLVGAKPRGPGMERSDLLVDNGKIFIAQGQALNETADPNVKVLVVGNPCNTNCLIAKYYAPKIPRKNFHAMTMLDQNRAVFQLAHKASVDISDVSNMVIWGNHSSTQVPDFFNAKIKGVAAKEVINDQIWFEKEFIPNIQKRGAAVIAARGKSSAASAASAAIDAFKAILTPTRVGQWFSSGVCSHDNPYGIENDLIFSFPCQSNGDGDYKIAENISWDKYLKEKIKVSELELVEERELIKHLLQ
jgi:malate dehydrogenase